MLVSETIWRPTCHLPVMLKSCCRGGHLGSVEDSPVEDQTSAGGTMVGIGQALGPEAAGGRAPASGAWVEVLGGFCEDDAICRDLLEAVNGQLWVYLHVTEQDEGYDCLKTCEWFTCRFHRYFSFYFSFLFSPSLSPPLFINNVLFLLFLSKTRRE